ncbi:MAG: type II toxin-antitoxin system VapC family toxin [Micrococcales bacterium]|nr:type II toxin-antitoxin system VapC family toxin [Micrococcales bacterium]
MARVMIVLDNSVLVAYSQPEDAHHEPAVGLIAAHLGNLVVHSLTLADYMVHPVRLGEVEDHWEWITGSLDADNLEIKIVDAPGQRWPVHLARVRVATKLKMPDAVVLATALALGGQVATFDEGLMKAARSHGALLG